MLLNKWRKIIKIDKDKGASSIGLILQEPNAQSSITNRYAFAIERLRKSSEGLDEYRSENEHSVYLKKVREVC
jgi:hypothetical protein